MQQNSLYGFPNLSLEVVVLDGQGAGGAGKAGEVEGGLE